MKPWIRQEPRAGCLAISRRPRSIAMMPRSVNMRLGAAAGGLAFAFGLTWSAGAMAGPGPRFFFQVQEVKAGPEVDATLKAYAGEALKAELASRPEWASDLGPASDQGRPGGDRGPLVEELKQRGLKGFDVSVRIVSFSKQLKDPKPGGRLKQLAVNVRLAVFGTTIPDAKLAFSDEGESGVEAEVSEKRLAADAESAAKDAIKDAIKQAVDQAVSKLSSGKSAGPGSHRRRKNG